MAEEAWAKRRENKMASSFEHSNTIDKTTTKKVNLTEKDIPGAQLPRETPEECNVPQLKRWLLCRGACTTSKKQLLITRLVKFRQHFWFCLLIFFTFYYLFSNQDVVNLQDKKLHEIWFVR